MKSLCTCACVLLMVGCGTKTMNPAVPFATGRGTSMGAARSLTLGPDGGVFAAADDRVRLEIPPGALTAITTLTLEPITCLAPGCQNGDAWRFGPEGTTFTSPVTLRFKVAPTLLEKRASLGLFGVAYQDADGFWNWVKDVSRDETAGTVTVTTTHLSDWSTLMGLQLRPLAAAVKTGGSLSLEVKNCLVEEQGGLATLMANCDDPLAPLVEAVKVWSVNGTKGGNATVGTVTASGAGATFTAPGKAPNPPTVAVTATVPDGTAGFGLTYLYSQVTIGTPEKFAGTFTVVASPASVPVTLTIEANNLTLTLKDEGIDETNYTMVGTAQMKTKAFQLGDMSCVLKPSEETKAIRDNFKVRKQPALAVRWGWSDLFIYQCTSAGSQVDWPVMVYFMTATGSNCLSFADVPISDAMAPGGRFLCSCSPHGPTTAEWSFTPSQ